MSTERYANYITILERELVPAMGCTEPIAVALAAARAREVLGAMPKRMVVYCSGNIIKNVKGVNVPNSGGQRGVEVAAVLGALAGDAARELQVISDVPAGAAEEVRNLVASGICRCELQEGVEKLYIRVEAHKGEDKAVVELKTKHNHFSRIEKNGAVLFTAEDIPIQERGDKSQLNLRDILEFANGVDMKDVEHIIKRQLDCNGAISEEGMKGSWGASVGRTLAEIGGTNTRNMAAAKAAAGSDARMGGCALPVVINSGSGNQGITCTLPVLTYARALQVSEEKLCRAMVLTNLIAIHQKRYIGDLSAYCGAVSAGTAAACGVAYLENADYNLIGKTIINSLGNTGGIICDGAKSSCAAKIASAVNGGLLGYEMAKRERYFQFGEGVVDGDYERTIRNFGRIGHDGMKETDLEILNIMTGR